MLLSRPAIQARIRSGELGIKVDLDGEMIEVESPDQIETHLNIRTAKLDLHVGSQYALYSEAGIRPLAAITMTLQGRQHAIIKPGDGIVFRTREYLRMPRNLIGFVASKVGFSTLGLSSVSATVDPTFEGFLIITVWNQSMDEIHLTTQDAVATLSFAELDQPVPEGTSVRSQKGSLFECVWGSILKDYLPHGGAATLEEILEEIRKDEGLEGKPYQALYNEIRRRRNRFDR